MAESNSNTNTPNLDKELKDDDNKANDNQSGNVRREIFEKAHGDDSPSNNPSGGPPRDDRPAPPDTREPLREPTENPTQTSPKP